MFTGIVEGTGIVTALKKEKSNLHISIRAPFLKEIKVDQSIAHDGVCLTVTEINPAQLTGSKKKENKPGFYTVTAILETLQKSNLKFLKKGDKINLERCMKADGRFDGHIVQGHVDCTAKVISIREENGSWVFSFQIISKKNQNTKLVVEKGSICINGVSLTVIDCSENTFSVAIIPYTYFNTNFNYLKPGNMANIEFDIIGKYIAKMQSFHSS